MLLGCSGFKNLEAEAQSKAGAIIPIPWEQEIEEGIYIIPRKNIVCYNQASGSAAIHLENLLNAAGIEVQVAEEEDCGNWKLHVDHGLLPQTGEEGYLLSITQNGIELKAATPAGLFYGIQSIRQLLPEKLENNSFIFGKIALQHQEIKDNPKYSWRGSMLDVARNFFGVDYIKKHLERMALYKLNRLHLHLTDDQGWRIEIKSRPLLTEIGSKGAVINGTSGYITQEEYIDLQEYAAARNIVIIPEIDLPGHIYAALLAYPELSCDNYSNLTPARATPPQLYTGYEVGWSKLCLEKPETYTFVEDVIKELAAITRGPWIHIGGDEIDDPLYEEFVVKADAIVRKTGKTGIGWEEVTKAPVHNSLISQRWNGKTKAVTNVKIIESICTSFYLDHANIPGQETTNNWCNATGVSLENVYNFSIDNENVIGVEAPVWTELVITEAMLDDRFWPRSIAVAEVGWSRHKKDYTAFLERLQQHETRLKTLDISYFPSPELNWNKD